MYLEPIKQPQDIKKYSMEELTGLAAEMRGALMNRLSKRGGHFGPNFGMVEATIALHYVFDSPKDKLVFDVSHQCYCHKMLTGRQNGFLQEEHFGDISGFTNPNESEHDFFVVGHTSTSISLASGLAKARDLKGDKENIIAIIGDGSLSGGEALEGLDYAAELGTNFIIVVNDNDMSIAENHGGLYRNLKLLRETNGQAECNLLKAMGVDYLFVQDGNDLEQLISAFQKVKDIDHPIVVHICTEKGKGYEPAVQNKEGWHWHMPFDPKTGESLVVGGENYSTLTADYMLARMKEDPTLAMITAGTPTVAGFTKEKRELAGKQFIDVGIAEEQAVAMASGMAKNGGNPVFGVSSTFMQRTYDQVSHDVCINKNPVTFLIFSATIYGMSDVTHLGIYDIAMLSNIPDLVYLAPVTKEEYFAMLDYSLQQKEHPIAIRVPASVVSDVSQPKKDYGKLNEYVVAKKGKKAAILGLGNFFGLAQQAVELLKAETGIEATLINPIYITGVDETLLEQLKDDHDIVITLEDGILNGGFGEKIARFYGASQMKVLNYGFKKEFLDRFDIGEVLKKNRLTAGQIVEDIKANI